LTEKYYPNPILAKFVHTFGLDSYYRLEEKIRETNFLITLIIEDVEQCKKQLEEAIATSHQKGRKKS